MDFVGVSLKHADLGEKIDTVYTSINQLYYQKFLPLPRPIRFCLVVNFLFFIASNIFPKTMSRHATLCWSNLYFKRFHTLLTSAFNHFDIFHLYVNMSVLCGIGPSVYNQIGDKLFYGVLFSSSLVSSILSLIAKKLSLLFRNNYNRSVAESRNSVGFSGINMALFTLYAYLFPENKMLLSSPFSNLFFQQNNKTISSMTLLEFSLLFDIFGFLLSSTIVTSPFDHAAHLGGFLCSKFIIKFQKLRKKIF